MAQSERLSTGGFGLEAASMFANGIGPVQEPNENDANLTDLQKQLLYKGKNGTILNSKSTDKPYCYSPEDDWSINSSLKHKSDYKLMDCSIMPDPYKIELTYPTYVEVYDIDKAKEITKSMKKELMSGKALSAGICADDYNPSKADSKCRKYINTDNDKWAHYTYENKGTNHQITIVGWDDDYSKDNFLSEIEPANEEGSPIKDRFDKPITTPVNRPPENDAWICKNSWGAKDSWGQGFNNGSQWGIGGSGYFYLSYFDQSLRDVESYDMDINQDQNDNLIVHSYNNVPINIPKACYTGETQVETMNKFKAEQDEELSEVATVTAMEGETVTYNIYISETDENTGSSTFKNIDNFDVVYEHAGYHREILNKKSLSKKDNPFRLVLFIK